MSVKVLFWLKEFPKYSETFIRDQIVELINQGVEVHIFAHKKNGGQLAALNGLEQLELFEKTQSPGSLMPASKWARLKKIRALLTNTSNGEQKNSLKRSLNIFKHGRIAINGTLFFLTDYILRNQIDIIHAHYGPMGLQAVRIKANGCPVKVFCTFHGFDLRKGVSSLPKKPFDRLFQDADTILAISDYSSQVLQKIGAAPANIKLLPNGINWASYDCPQRQQIESVHILSVGRLVVEKDYHTALTALELLKKDAPEFNWNYTIVGSGELEAELKGFVQELSIAQQVTFAGALSSDQVRDKYCQADMFLLSSRVEVLPTVLLEAQASGLPCVATRVGAVAELLSETGFLADPQDANSLFMAIKAALNARSTWSEISQTQRKKVQSDYDLKAVTARLIEYYQQ